MGIMEKKSKNGVSEAVWNRVKEILEKRKVSQVRLKAMCEESGYSISQPEISRLFSGKAKLTLYQLIAFSDTLRVPLDQLIHPVLDAGILQISDIDNRADFQISGDSFITNPFQGAFDGYLGEYRTVFHCTEPNEDKFLYGKIWFNKNESKHICEVIFKLDTGEKDQNQKAIIKEYHGQFIVSARMNVGYCILLNERMGEICSLEFRHRSFLIKQAQCRLGMVLTVSAGELKRPVVHRILLCRNEITPVLLSKVSPFLKMGIGEVMVSRKALTELIYHSEKLNNFNFESLLKHSDFEEVAFIDESSLRKINRRISNLEMAEIIAALRNISYGTAYVSYLSEKEDSQTYDILRRMELEKSRD